MNEKLLKVTISDREECIGCGACWGVCPEFFEENLEDGLSQIVEAYRFEGNIAEGRAPEMLDECVRDAEEGCPVGIIHVEEEAEE
ncbi:MAG TPA: ferredoxin [Chloroflexi bacterium]|nr:ferredoxin [Chloroflexota bacterium]